MWNLLYICNSSNTSSAVLVEGLVQHQSQNKKEHLYILRQYVAYIDDMHIEGHRCDQIKRNISSLMPTSSPVTNTGT
jgi:hypothetical protein